jgi:hypothetical protein
MARQRITMYYLAIPNTWDIINYKNELYNCNF